MGAKKTFSYREKNNGNREGDGHQHCQPDEEHQHIQGVHAAVGVQQLRLHATWRPECNIWHISSTKLTNKCARALDKCVIHNVRQHKVTLKFQVCFFCGCFLNFTKKREVAEEGGEQVHDKHGQDGDVGDVLDRKSVV